MIETSVCCQERVPMILIGYYNPSGEKAELFLFSMTIDLQMSLDYSDSQSLKSYCKIISKLSIRYFSQKCISNKSIVSFNFFVNFCR